MDDIRNLECFIEVARHKSFSRAAEKMYLSQPSMSRAIKDLELQLGITLFYRDTRSVRLTDAGTIILPQAQAIVSSFQSMASQLNDLKEMKLGKIYLALPPITAITAFSRLINTFKRSYPNISIFIEELGPKKIEKQLQDGLLDFGIFDPYDNADLYEKLWFEQDTFDVLMSSDNPLSQQKLIEFKDLQNESFILYTKDYKLHDWIVQGCKTAGFLPNIILETTQRDWMIEMVSENQGIALLPSKICKKIQLPTVLSKPFSPQQLTLCLALVWKKNSYLSYAAHEFLHFITAKLNEGSSSD